MEQDRNKLIEIFEEEVWLYLDNELPNERMIFWKNKIEEIDELKNILKNNHELLNLYSSSNENNISEEKFNTILERVITNKTLIQKINFAISKFFNSSNEFQFGKIAFASLLLVITIGISLLSNKETPLKKLTKEINNELLDWDAKFFDDKISKVETLMNISKDEDYRKYYKYNMASESIGKNINLLDNKLKTLKKEINNNDL